MAAKPKKGTYVVRAEGGIMHIVDGDAFQFSGDKISIFLKEECVAVILRSISIVKQPEPPRGGK